MKKLHIISHTHWDREWYMPFELHRMRLVTLLDTLIETMELNPEYQYYHLDGQTIIIEDYLEIRPEMKDRLLKLIREERIQIGPWYVLQDEYLTSGEAAVRNMRKGLQMCRELGAKAVMIGYFPDAFGNISQSPQILQQFGIDTAVFGRGINDVFENNTMGDTKGSAKSEICWKSPDGSEVLGVIFSNWYNNANELQTHPKKLEKQFEQIIRNTEKYAVTDQLLAMNGCDHQPIQTDITIAISEAKKLFDGRIEIIHSNFKDYVASLNGRTKDLKCFQGEIYGQGGTGYGTLVNTASSRIDLKIKNFDAQYQLERITEPLCSLASLNGAKYPYNFLEYSWKKLMQNHPHDSICCCSVDAVHEEMNVRFNKSLQVAKGLAENAIAFLVEEVDEKPKTVTVLNLKPKAATGTVHFFLDLPEQEKAIPTSFYMDGKFLPSEIKPLGIAFNYKLPDNSFRVVQHVNRYEVELMAVDIPAFFAKEITVLYEEAEDTPNGVFCGENYIENNKLRLDFEGDGSFVLYDKENKNRFENCFVFEDCRDMGNEYNFEPSNFAQVTSRGKTATVETILHSDLYAEVIVTLDLPCAEGTETQIKTSIALYADSNYVKFVSEIGNNQKNHRIRILFSTDTDTDSVYADTPFDICERPIVPGKKWENPSNCQRMSSFCSVNDFHRGLVFAARGLNEYEILRDGHNTIAVTLLRCVGQIGDWGYFPTPDAQMQGSYKMEYSIIPFDGRNRFQACQTADELCFPSLTALTGKVKMKTARVISIPNDKLRFSNFSRNADTEECEVRLYNMSNETVLTAVEVCENVRELSMVSLDGSEICKLKLQNGQSEIIVKPKQIITLCLKF